ncbi:unnamed protein product [Toxocara canis]|uniref:MADF domain-containing protein n=1 Tax=Toxocara canis TaxID=6265 RepID=A0A183TWV9_TOXCA|nr:unnamed protein product [Toxocara canis]
MLSLMELWLQDPKTIPAADVDPLSNCITGMADMGFGLQPRMLSILDEPLNSTPLDDHPPHRTPAVTLTEVPVHEDDENIYTSEMKVVTDWFNHAPYGAGRDAHIRYWDDVRQRVIVADWIRKLQQKRFDQRTKGKRRSKSTEPWWPRKLFEHYEGALDLAGKVMRTADSSSGACDSEVPSINNVAMKVIRLDDDETATLAYFRPGSPLTVSDPTDDYQEHVLAQDLDEATLITAGSFFKAYFIFVLIMLGH